MLEHCRVVLVGPMFGGNVGAAARAIKNTGLGPLHLVQAVYRDHAEATRFSHGAEEILESAVRHDDLLGAIGDSERVVGFTARERHRRAIVPLRRFATEWVEVALERAPKTALVFGRERDGLTNAELDRCTDLVWIPAHPDHPSFNLSQAVLLCGYEMLCARAEVDAELPRLHPRRTKRPSPSPLASGEDVDAMLRHLRTAFLEIGYAYPHTVEPMVRSWQEVFARAKLHRREATMIRGLAQQILWATQYLPAEHRPAKRSDTSEPLDGVLDAADHDEPTDLNERE